MKHLCPEPLGQSVSAGVVQVGVFGKVLHPCRWSLAGGEGYLGHLAEPWWVVIVPEAIVPYLYGVTER